MKRLNRFWAVALVIAAATFAPSCSRSKEGTFRIGAALPLTGPVAYYGQSPQKGMAIALDEINGSGGVNGQKVEVIYEDTMGNAKGAVNAFRKLVAVDKPPVVIGAGASIETLSIAKLADESQVVLLSPVSSAAEIRDAGDYVFRTVPSDALQAVMLAKWVIDAGYRKISVMFLNSSWSTSLKTHFVDEYVRLGGQVLDTESADVDETDFRTQLLKVSRSSPQVVVALLYAKEGGRCLKQARELGITLPFFGGDPWTIKDFLEIGGSAVEGARFTTPAQYDGAEAQAFQKKYLARYGTSPDVYAAHGYDALKLIAEVVRKGASTGPEIKQKLYETRDFQGATGNTTFDDHGDVVSKQFIRMTVKDGKVIPVNQ